MPFSKFWQLHLSYEGRTRKCLIHSQGKCTILFQCSPSKHLRTLLSTPAIPRLPSDIADGFSIPGSKTTSAASTPFHIHSIPPEILTRIFVWLITLDPIVGPWGGVSSHTRLAWIVPATHVCARWRAVAISNPCLWTEINPNTIGIEWALEMARRACQAPIDVHTDADCMPLLDYVVEHIDHVRHLQLRDGRQGNMTSVLARLNRPAPMLESVDIFCSRMCAVPFPTDLFANTTPRLRHVWLSKCYIPPNHSVLSASLVLLKIDMGTTDQTPPKYTYDELLDVLERMPDLEVLHLKPLPLPVPASMSISRSVSLPHLDVLRLEGGLSGCRRLAASLDLPAHTSIRMICSSLSYNGEDCHLLVPFITERIAAAATIHPIEHLYVSSLSDTFIRLCFGPIEPHMTRFSALPLDVDLCFPSADDEVPRWLFETVCAALPLDELRTLSVFTGQESWLHPEHWQETLRPAKGVETVNVRGAAARRLVSSLRIESRADEPPDEAPTWLFPALKAFGLWELLGIHEIAPWIPRLNEALAGALASRTLKAPLEALRLLYCQGQMEWIETFEAIVPTVTVDSDAPFPPPFRYLGSMHEA